MAKIGLVTHDAEQAALDEAARLRSWLGSAGHETVLADSEPFPDDLDLAISLGGDGTMLRTVALVGDAPIKILGVNFGDLGFLTVVDPDELDQAVERCLSGDHDLEERMIVSASIRDTTVHALNDIVVERTSGDTTVRIAVSIDGRPFTTYPADGLIVATPTGSTAYALSARGPIVFPTHSALQLTPVSPHMLFDRSLVLGPESVIELTLEGHRPALVSQDGNTVLTMTPGETIVAPLS